MRKKGYKGRCEKKKLDKCKDICRTYDVIQSAYADILSECEDIAEIRCNVFLDGLDIGEYTTDFVCVDGSGVCISEISAKTHDCETIGCIKELLVKAWCYGLGAGG